MRLSGMRVAMPVGPLFEDLEYWVVRMRLEEEGALVTSLGEAKGAVYRSKSGGLEAVAELAFRDATADAFDAIAVPGGFAPDKMRRDQALLALVRDLDARGAPLGFICHAGWVAASARIIQGRRVTGSKGIKDDLENAGGLWVDQAAFRDGKRVWGRVVEDIPAYNRELVALFAEHWQGLH